jgi:hypothetical protein
LRVVPITKNPQRGSSKETFTRNGNQKVPSCGFTESVRPVPIFYPILPDDVLIFNCSRLGQEYSLVRPSLAPFIIDYLYRSSVQRSSKILKPYVTPVKHRWDSFISTFGTPTNNPCTTYSLPFSHSFLLARAPAATLYLNFIRFIITERTSLVTVF